MKIYYVYAYLCPDSDVILYVGKGKYKRAWDHLNAAKENKKHSSNNHWHYKLKQIISQGKEPKIVMLNEGLTSLEALDIETALIAKYGRRDYDEGGILYNVCPKANDWTGLKHKQESKDKISAKKLGVKRTPEAIEKSRLGIIGTKHPPRSEQWKQLQRESHLGLKDTNNPNRVAAHTGANNPRAKIWNLECEDGSTFQVIALKTWCRENGLNFDHITRTKKTGKFASGIRVKL